METKIKRPRRPYLVRAKEAFETAAKFAREIYANNDAFTEMSAVADACEAAATSCDKLPAPKKTKPGVFAVGSMVKLREKYVSKQGAQMTDVERQTMVVDEYDAVSKTYIIKTNERKFVLKGRHIEIL